MPLVVVPATTRRLSQLPLVLHLRTLGRPFGAWHAQELCHGALVKAFFGVCKNRMIGRPLRCPLTANADFSHPRSRMYLRSEA